MRTWHTNTWGNAHFADEPQDGFVAGILASIFFDTLLGLTDRSARFARQHPGRDIALPGAP